MFTAANIYKKSIAFKNGTYILYLLNDKEVVYIGGTTKNVPNLYGHRDKDFNRYYVSGINPNDEVNIKIAEEIIRFCPKYNTQLPSNNRYMRKSVIKSTFDINGHDLNRVIKKKYATPVYLDYYDIREVFNKRGGSL
jgi:hypothetical protein